jgi:hypothetical protein
MGFRVRAWRAFERSWPSCLLFVVGASVSCASPLPRDGAEGEIHVVYDPANGKIPMPNDLVRDAAGEHLALPIGDDLSAAEVELREFMNTHDAWPTTFPLTAELSGPAMPGTIRADTVLVYQWGALPRRVTDVSPRLEEGGTKIVIDPPLLGWSRGARYVVAVRGGEAGVRDAEGRGIGPDRTFWFLRARERLDTYAQNRAFPGATRDERLAVGERLEGLRSELVPFFDALERQPAPVLREEVAALWAFSITRSPELAMDRESQRVPLPFDVLIDPATGLVSLPPSPKDDTRETAAKAQLNQLNGFGLAPTIDFELTYAADPRTATAETVRVYEIASGRELRTSSVEVLPSVGSLRCRSAVVPEVCTRLSVRLAEDELPLRPATEYAVVVSDGLLARDGARVRAMLMGHFVGARHPLVENGESQVAALPLETAERLEGVRAKVAPLLARIGRDHVVAAWPFTTLDAEPRLREAAALPALAGYEATPTITRSTEVRPGLLGLPSKSEIDVFDSLFPPIVDDIIGTVYVPRVRGVRRVVEGTIASPSTLDPKSRAARADGRFSREDVRFVMTLPEAPASGTKVPVVMFGHGLMTDRRFVLMIAGALARKGFAAISFDFPFHGERTECTHSSLVAIPNFFPDDIRKLSSQLSGDMLSFPPCPSGAQCNAEGQCQARSGEIVSLAKIPLTDMPVAGGSALIDVEDLPHIKDRMTQALVDMVAVRRSLREADWSQITGGIELERDRVFYTGQSLGGILGAVFSAVTDDVERAVLNVPGADLVGLFRESFYFAPQMEAFLEREKLVEGSYERERLLDVARWLMDAVDPHSLAGTLGKRQVLLQMGQGDIVIPNRVTERLRRASALPMKTYLSPFHGDLVMPVVGDAMLEDLVSFLADE